MFFTNENLFNLRIVKHYQNAAVKSGIAIAIFLTRYCSLCLILLSFSHTITPLRLRTSHMLSSICTYSKLQYMARPIFVSGQGMRFLSLDETCAAIYLRSKKLQFRVCIDRWQHTYP